MSYQRSSRSRPDDFLHHHMSASRMSNASSSQQNLASAACQRPPSKLSARSSASRLNAHNEATLPSSSKEQQRLNKRRNVVKELVDTEHRFTQDMTIIVEFYMHTVEACDGISPPETATLFGNSSAIKEFSSLFQDSLKRASRSIYVIPQSQRYHSKRKPSRPSSSTDAKPKEISYEADNATTIGSAFLEHLQRMEIVYTHYLLNHDLANQTLGAVSKRDSVDLWLSECRRYSVGLTDAWDLDSLLVKPVQRLLKYPLLLNELASVTPAEHPDRTALMKAIEEITQVSLRINERKRQLDLDNNGQDSSSRNWRKNVDKSKALFRRTDKDRRPDKDGKGKRTIIFDFNVLAEKYADNQYEALARQFEHDFSRLQHVMRDIERYLASTQKQMKKFSDFMHAVDHFMDGNASRSQSGTTEQNWHIFRASVQELKDKTMPDHVGTVRGAVVKPIMSLLLSHTNPQCLMHQRAGLLTGYLHVRGLEDGGEKIDRKGKETIAEFESLNAKLKEQLPTLFRCTRVLVESCLGKFIQIQTKYFSKQQRRLVLICQKLQMVNLLLAESKEDEERAFERICGAFLLQDDELRSLGICDGSLLANLASTDVHYPPSRASSATESRSRHSHESHYSPSEKNGSRSREHSHDISRPSSRSPMKPESILSGVQRAISGRTSSDRKSRTSETNRPVPVRALSNTSAETYATPPESLDRAVSHDFMQDRLLAASSSNRSYSRELERDEHNAVMSVPGYTSSSASESFLSSPKKSSEYSSFTSPALTNKSEPLNSPSPLFLATSMNDFSPNATYHEDGLPYLAHKPGELFEVFSETGELYLVKSRNNPSPGLGWVWSKYVSKLGIPTRQSSAA